MNESEAADGKLRIAHLLMCRDVLNVLDVFLAVGLARDCQFECPLIGTYFACSHRLTVAVVTELRWTCERESTHLQN